MYQNPEFKLARNTELSFTEAHLTDWNSVSGHQHASFANRK